MNPYEDLARHVASFSSLPAEAVVKQDVLRLGMWFDPGSFQGCFKAKDYFIFSFDMAEPDQVDAGMFRKVPEEIALSGGPFGLKRTIISVRLNPKSPYVVIHENGMNRLTCLGNLVGDVAFHPLPAHYAHELTGQRSMGEVAPVLEWGYLIYLTVFRHCQYFQRGEHCRFCEMNQHAVHQRKKGREPQRITAMSDILDALAVMDREDRTAQAYTITGGSIVDHLDGKSEVEFYGQYIRAIEDRFPGRWISKAVVEAFEKEDCQKLKDWGLVIYHPNYEVWGEDMFGRLCPGKARAVGFHTWCRRIVESGRVFGPSCVIPNFVAGVEMNQQWGFREAQQAVDHTAEGLDWFMSRGIMPRFTTWCPEPRAALGPQPPPPLEYYCRLLQAWRDLFVHYRLPVPMGYGEPGPGKAVFSVSSFMDVMPGHPDSRQ